MVRDTWRNESWHVWSNRSLRIFFPLCENVNERVASMPMTKMPIIMISLSRMGRDANRHFSLLFSA